MTVSGYPMFVNPSYFGGSACIVLNVSLILFIVAFSTPFWFESGDSYNAGLWQACYRMPADADADDGSSSVSTTPAAADQWKCGSASDWITSTAPGVEGDWLVGVEAILTVSLMFLILTSVALTLFTATSPVRREHAQGIVFTSFCLTFAIACFSLTAVIVTGVQVSQENSGVHGAELSWSYVIAAITTCLFWFCALALLVEVIRVMAGAPVYPDQGSISAQQSFHAHYRSLELRESFASGLDVHQDEAVGNEVETSTIRNEARDNQSETDVQDGGGNSDRPEASLAAGLAGNSLYESVGILPSQFYPSDMRVGE